MSLRSRALSPARMASAKTLTIFFGVDPEEIGTQDALRTILDPWRPERRAYESIFLRCSRLARTIAGSRASSGGTWKCLVSRSSFLLLRGLAIRTRCMSHPPGNAWCAVRRQPGPSVVRVHRRQHPVTSNSHHRTWVSVAVPRWWGFPTERSSGRRQDEGSAVRHRSRMDRGAFGWGTRCPTCASPRVFLEVNHGRRAFCRRCGGSWDRLLSEGRVWAAAALRHPSMPRSTPNA